MEKCLIYDVVLDVDKLNDLSCYSIELDTLCFILPVVLNGYEGYSKVYIDVGNYQIKEMDTFVKKLSPHIHLFFYGSEIDFIEKRMTDFLENGHQYLSYEKYEVFDNPFDEDNSQLLYDISYKRLMFTLNHKSTSPLALLNRYHQYICPNKV